MGRPGWGRTPGGVQGREVWPVGQAQETQKTLVQLGPQTQGTCSQTQGSGWR